MLVMTGRHNPVRHARPEVSLARGKKLYDKRETITRRENEREMERALKKRREKR